MSIIVERFLLACVYQIMCANVKMKPKLPFPVLIRGIDYLRSAATNMAGAKVKFGMITGDALGFQK